MPRHTSREVVMMGGELRSLGPKSPGALLFQARAVVMTPVRMLRTAQGIGKPAMTWFAPGVPAS